MSARPLCASFLLIAASTFFRRDDVGMHFPNVIYEREVLPLLGYACGMKNCEFTNTGSTYINQKDMQDANNSNKKPAPGGRDVKKRLAGLKALKAHLRIEHGYALCDLCVDNRRDFVSRLARYTPRGLKDHQSKGDGDLSGFTGHPLCEFCRPLRFYDIAKLHEHLNKEHYKCHICDKLGRPNQFFKDYERLERHFDREHFMCHDPQCLAARFVVFENEIDLRGHEANVHGTSRRDGGTKIKLEFRVRREGEHLEQSLPNGDDFQFGLNGEAFVPDALPGQQQRQANEPQISHPLHAARTAELRAQAARVRERDGGTAVGGNGSGSSEAFPALGPDANARGMLVGWTSGGARTAASRPGTAGLRKTPVGRVTAEEFPSLGGPSVPGSTNRYAALGLGRRAKPVTRQGGGFNFSAAASRPTCTTARATGSAPIPGMQSYATSAPSMGRNDFPSLGGGPRAFVAAYPTSSSSSRAAPNVRSSDNFPSLGGGGNRAKSSAAAQSSNPYAAAQAHAKKLNAGKTLGSAPSASSAYPALSSSADFPAPPVSGAKKSKMKAAFAPKKPPPMDNVMQFPPPSSSSMMTKNESIQAGKETVQSLKQILGSVRYKKLKSLTRAFAEGATSPESYVDDAASLFDGGVGDAAFWDHIPPLINDIPNKMAVSRAMQHLDSLGMANQMQQMEFSGGNMNGKKKPTATNKKPINLVLPAKKKKASTAANSWGRK